MASKKNGKSSNSGGLRREGNCFRQPSIAAELNRHCRPVDYDGKSGAVLDLRTISADANDQRGILEGIIDPGSALDPEAFE